MHSRGTTLIDPQRGLLSPADRQHFVGDRFPG
jgi:hypothetical protein